MLGLKNLFILHNRCFLHLDEHLPVLHSPIVSTILFTASMSIIVLDYMYKWSYLVYFFFFLSLSILSSSFIHVVTKDRIYFFYEAFLSILTHKWTFMLFPYLSYCEQCCSSFFVIFLGHVSILKFCIYSFISLLTGLPRWLSGKEFISQCKETQEARVQSLGWQDSLEEEMATHSSILFFF